jgi:hypothetical protein
MLDLCHGDALLDRTCRSLLLSVAVAIVVAVVVVAVATSLRKSYAMRDKIASGGSPESGVCSRGLVLVA